MPNPLDHNGSSQDSIDDPGRNSTSTLVRRSEGWSAHPVSSNIKVQGQDDALCMQGSLIIQRAWQAFKRRRALRIARQQLHINRRVSGVDEDVDVVQELEIYTKFLELKQKAEAVRGVPVELNGVVPPEELQGSLKGTWAATCRLIDSWLLFGMAVLFGIAQTACSVLLAGFWVTLIAQVLLGTTVGSTNISTIVFFLLLALLVYVLVATTNELLWASLKESVVRQLDLKLLATVLGNSKLISSEEVRTLRATHFPMFGNVVCFPLWTYAGQGRGRVLCIVRGFEVFDAIPVCVGCVLVLAASLIYSFVISPYSGLIYLLFLILQGIVAIQSSHLTLTYGRDMTKQITAARGLWDSLTFGGNSRDAHTATMTAISESIEGGWIQRRRYSAGLLALRLAYNLLLLGCPVAYLYVGMTVIKDGSLHGQDAVRQLVVLACGLGSMKVFHTGLLAITNGLPALTRVVGMMDAIACLKPHPLPETNASDVVRRTRTRRNSCLAGLTWLVVFVAFLGVLVASAVESGSGCPSVRVTCALTDAQGTALAAVPIRQAFSAAEGCRCVQTEAEIVQECADALADASGRAAGPATVSATWLDWTNTQQFVRARAVALPTPNRRTQLTIGNTDVGKTSGCDPTNVCSAACPATCQALPALTSVACAALGSPSDCGFQFATGPGSATGAGVTVTLTDTTSAYIQVTTPTQHVSGRLTSLPLFKLTPAMARLDNVIAVAHALAAELGLTTDVGSWTLTVDDQNTKTTGTVSFTGTAVASELSLQLDSGKAGTTAAFTGAVGADGTATLSETLRCANFGDYGACFEGNTASLYLQPVTTRTATGATTVLTGSAQDKGDHWLVVIPLDASKFGKMPGLVWGRGAAFELALPKAGGITYQGPTHTASLGGVLDLAVTFSIDTAVGLLVDAAVSLNARALSMSGTLSGVFTSSSFTPTSMQATGTLDPFTVTISKASETAPWAFALGVQSNTVADGVVTFSDSQVDVAGSLYLDAAINAPDIDIPAIAYAAMLGPSGFRLEVVASDWKLAMLPAVATVLMELPNANNQPQLTATLRLQAPTTAGTAWHVTGTAVVRLVPTRLSVSLDGTVHVPAANTEVDLVVPEAGVALNAGGRTTLALPQIASTVRINGAEVLAGTALIGYDSGRPTRVDFTLRLTMPPRDPITRLVGTLTGRLGRTGYALSGSVDVGVMGLVDVVGTVYLSSDGDACPCAGSGLCFDGQGTLKQSGVTIQGTVGGCKVPTGWKLHHVDLSGTVADIITFKAYTASDGLGVSMGLPDTLLRMSLAPSASSPSKKQAIGALTWPDMGQVKLPDLSLATEVANDLVIRRALPDFDLILVEVLSPTVEINPLQGLSLTADVRSGLDLFDLDGSIGLLLQPSHGLALQFDLTGSIPGIPVTLRVSGLWTTSITKRLDVSLEAGAARAAGSITLDLGKLAFEGEVDIPKIGIVPELHLDLRGEMDLKDRRFSLESSLSTNLWNVLLLDGKLSIPSRGKADVDCSISTRSLDPIQIDGRLTANMQESGLITGSADIDLYVFGEKVLDGSATLAEDAFSFSGTLCVHCLPYARALFGTAVASVSGRIAGSEVSFAAGLALNLKNGRLGFPMEYEGTTTFSSGGVSTAIEWLYLDVGVLTLEGSGQLELSRSAPPTIDVALRVVAASSFFSLSGSIQLTLRDWALALAVDNARLVLGPLALRADLAAAIEPGKVAFAAGLKSVTVFGNTLSVSGGVELDVEKDRGYQHLRTWVNNLQIGLGPMTLSCSRLDLATGWYSGSGIRIEWQGSCSGRLGSVSWGALGFYASSSLLRVRLKFLGTQFNLEGSAQGGNYDLAGDVSKSIENSLTTSIKYPCGHSWCQKCQTVFGKRVCAPKYPCKFKSCYVSLGSYSASLKFSFALSKRSGALSSSVNVGATVRYAGKKATFNQALGVSSLPTSTGAVYNTIKNNLKNALKRFISKTFSLSHREAVLHAPLKFEPQQAEGADVKAVDCCAQAFTEVEGATVQLTIDPGCLQRCTWEFAPPGGATGMALQMTFDQLQLAPGHSLRMWYYPDQDAAAYPKVYLLNSDHDAARFPQFTTSKIRLEFRPAVPAATWPLYPARPDIAQGRVLVGSRALPARNRLLQDARALRTDGTAESYAVLQSQVPVGTAESVMLWLLLAPPPATATTALCRPGAWCLQYTATGALRFACDQSAAAAVTELAVPPAVWVHVAGTCHPDVGARVYVNGHLQGVAEPSQETAPSNKAAPVVVGAKPCAPVDGTPTCLEGHLSGTFADVQLFDLDVDVKQLRELAGFSAARLPVAHWALDGDAADSGAIFGGTIEGAVPTEDRVAAAGRALLLQPGHYVQLPGVNLAELTLMAWVRPDTAPAAATALVCKGWAGPGGWCLRWLASRKLQFVCRAGGSEVAVESDAAQAPGQWVHVAGTCDRSEVTLVVNGVRQRAAGAMDGLPGQNAAPVVVGTPGAGAAHSYGLPAADQFAGAVWHNSPTVAASGKGVGFASGGVWQENGSACADVWVAAHQYQDDIKIFDVSMSSQQVKEEAALQAGPAPVSSWSLDGTDGAMVGGPAIIPDRDGELSALFLDGYRGQYVSLGTEPGSPTFTVMLWASFAAFGPDVQALACNSAPGACDSTQVTLYINGIQQGSGKSMEGPPQGSSLPVIVGGHMACVDYPTCTAPTVEKAYYGSIDDVRVLYSTVDALQVLVAAGLVEAEEQQGQGGHSTTDTVLTLDWLAPLDATQVCQCGVTEECVMDSNDKNEVFFACRPKKTPEQICAELGCASACLNVAQDGDEPTYVCKETLCEDHVEEDACAAPIDETEEVWDLSGCGQLPNVTGNWTGNGTGGEGDPVLISGVTEEDLLYLNCANETIDAPIQNETLPVVPDAEPPTCPGRGGADDGDGDDHHNNGNGNGNGNGNRNGNGNGKSKFRAFRKQSFGRRRPIVDLDVALAQRV